MLETHEQLLARRRRELAKRYGQPQATNSGVLSDQQESDIAQIVEKARQHGVGSVHHSHELTALLSTIAPDQQVPPALCNAVASLMVWLQKLEEQSAEGMPSAK